MTILQKQVKIADKASKNIAVVFNLGHNHGLLQK